MLGLYSFFSLAMVGTMFITGGRAGQVVFFVMILILIIQFFKEQRMKALMAILILLPGIFIAAYQTSPLFQDRVDLSITEVFNYEKTTNSSVGKRLTYAINSLEIIKENPLIGVGTGDFPVEYQKINIANKSNTPNSTNPHNMYTLILVQLGLLGLISMLAIFYYQIKLSFNSSDKFIRDAGITLPLLFLVVMFSDSYLLGHYTTLMFVFFSAFLYQDSEKTY
jgi:O-antigen ligase